MEKKIEVNKKVKFTGKSGARSKFALNGNLCNSTRMNDGNGLSFYSQYSTQLLSLESSEYRLMSELFTAFFSDVSFFFLSQNLYIVR